MASAPPILGPHAICSLSPGNPARLIRHNYGSPPPKRSGYQFKESYTEFLSLQVSEYFRSVRFAHKIKGYQTPRESVFGESRCPRAAGAFITSVFNHLTHPVSTQLITNSLTHPSTSPCRPAPTSSALKPAPNLPTPTKWKAKSFPASAAAPKR